MTESLEDLAPSLREVRARFEALVEPYRSALWHYCRRLTGSVWDAEDLVQETMQRALARLADSWQPQNPRAYLFRMATNAWIDTCRQAVHREQVELTECLPGGGVEPDRLLEAHEAIARLVRVLTPLQRVVFLLCETLDFRAHEVATLVGTTEGAVKAALHRARARLAAAAADPPPQRPVADQSAAGGAASGVVQRYIAAFDARDPDAIAALLHEHAVTTIVGSAEEVGREVARGNSLAEWAAEPVEQWVRPGRLEGRDVLFVLARAEGGETVLYSLIELQVAGDAIVGQRVYFYSPELLEEAASRLGMAALTHGHQYRP